MKFGVREICNVVFKAKETMKIGSETFKKYQPVLYIDSATASTLEQATTSVYAQGGRGNTRLVTWEGEKTLTFTVTDALISPISLSILSGAGIVKNSTDTVHVHVTSKATISISGANKIIDLSGALNDGEEIDGKAPLFVSKVDAKGDLTGTILNSVTVSGTDAQTLVTTDTSAASGDVVFVDFYITKAGSSVNELQITASSFGGNFYVEAATLFREKTTGKDYPVEITIPNVKIQSNFTFSMASTGDPSTFDFTMDAMPGYTAFDQTKEVLCVMQIVEDTAAGTDETHSVMANHSTENHPSDQVDSTDTPSAS